MATSQAHKAIMTQGITDPELSFAAKNGPFSKKLADTDPVELGSAFVGELVAHRDKDVCDRYMASSIEFHFLRAYAQWIKPPFREAIMRAKLKWV
jgi:hypothetical protein